MLSISSQSALKLVKPKLQEIQEKRNHWGRISSCLLGCVGSELPSSAQTRASRWLVAGTKHRGKKKKPACPLPIAALWSESRVWTNSACRRWLSFSWRREWEHTFAVRCVDAWRAGTVLSGCGFASLITCAIAWLSMCVVCTLPCGASLGPDYLSEGSLGTLPRARALGLVSGRSGVEPRALGLNQALSTGLGPMEDMSALSHPPSVDNFFWTLLRHCPRPWGCSSLQITSVVPSGNIGWKGCRQLRGLHKELRAGMDMCWGIGVMWSHGQSHGHVEMELLKEELQLFHKRTAAKRSWTENRAGDPIETEEL